METEFVRSMERSVDQIVEAWLHLFQLRDHETEGHSLRVTALAVRMASEFGLSERELVTVRRGSLLHDIGKLAIPEAILYKPAPLTLDEFKTMRKHPTYGFELVRKVDALKDAAEIVRYHHEMWDGSGYPDGLVGDQTPLIARIVALIEVWDALRSDHIYRRAWTYEKARDYILEQSGKAFDPKIVERFLPMVEPGV
jgi:putative nucleotidyltransferase with HDIG domain